MQDGEVVAAIVAGDPDGLAEAYDRYAAPLYAYCSFMLPGPDDAAGVVRDTFIIATSRLEGLRDPGRLRSWLHAVARNECLRRLGVAGVTSQPPGEGALPAVELPAALRRQVLEACTDSTPAGRAERASVAHRAGTFGPAGFPKAIGSPGPQWWLRLRRHPRAAAVVATVAAAAVAGGILAMLAAGDSHRAQASVVANGRGISPGAASASGAAGASGRAGRTSSASPQASPANGQPTPSVTALAGASSPGSPAGRSPTGRATPGGGTPGPSASPSGTSPSASPSPSSSPSQGILEAMPDRLVLTSTSGKSASGKFILSAAYGPVSNYVITVAPGMAGKITVAPAKGSLGEGGAVTITVTVTSKVTLDTDLTINPGDLTVTVLLSITKP